MAYIPASDDPGVVLAVDPCEKPPCKSMHELFVLIVLAMAQLNAEDSGGLEAATAKFRGMSKADGLQYMFSSFTAHARNEALADPNLPCFMCYSDQQLFQMFLFLWKKTVS